MPTHTTLGAVARRVFAAACVLAASHAFADAPEVPEDWLAAAQHDIEAREYHASHAAGALQAPNRAHNLRTWFEPTGIRVHDRTAPESPKLLGLALAGIGRGDSLAAVRPGRVASREARAEIAREGLLEWYENSAAGLEQGFTLAERPTGTGPLALELAVQGASASLHGDAVLFATQAGRTLRYDQLVVTDATGRALVARLAVPTPQRVRIEIEDTGAKYPLTIDPLLTQTADAQLEANQASASFGISVASAGDVNGDGFADVIVGATAYDAGHFDEGAAFVFLGSASGIASAGAGSAAARLESDQDSANFGVSVAGAGDVNGDGYADVIVGANQFNGPNPDAGAAFVFLGSLSGVSSGNPSTAAAVLHGPHDPGNFGGRVAGAGDVNGDGYADVIVSDANFGEVYVYHGSASGVLGGEIEVAATLLQASQPGFGSSLAGAGDMNGDGIDDVIVSAPLWDSGQTDEGAAFVYYGVSGSGIPSGDSTTADIRLESDQAGANFGIAVAGAGDVNGDGRADVIVSAPLYDSGETDEGAAFVFPGGMGATGNPTNASIRIESNQASGTLGTSVAGAGDVNGDGYADFIVGSFFAANGEAGEGRAFVFLGGAGGFNGDLTSAYASLESNQMFALLGGSVAGAGDVNGDGYADVIVGAALYDAGETDEGAAFVYLGGNPGIVDGSLTTAGATFSAPGGQLSASAGDVNGDGYDEIIIGVSGYTVAGMADAGAAFIFHGGANGIPSNDVVNAQGVILSDQAGALFGSDVAGAGDVDDDGYADVIVSAPGYDSGEVNEGAAFLFHGGPGGIGSVDIGDADAMIQSDQANSYLSFVASAGDVNGDGYSDVIAATPLYTNGEASEGAAFVFHGGAAGIGNRDPADADARIESNQTAAALGIACYEGTCSLQSRNVAGAGDVNGDGYADVIVGATFYDVGASTDAGAAWVYHGGPLGIQNGDPANADARLEWPSGYFGVVSAAGDVNADGYGDVAVGHTNVLSLGGVLVYHGSDAGIGDGSEGYESLVVGAAGALLVAVAGVGDLNGDGHADLVVGSPWYSAGELREGVVFALLGSPAGIATGTASSVAAAQIESNIIDLAFGGAPVGAGDVNGDGFADLLINTPLWTYGVPNLRQPVLYYGNANTAGRRALARQLSAGGFPVQPWGSSHSDALFQVRMNATHPGGRGRVKLQVEACSQGTPFDDPGCSSFTSPSWTDVTTTSSGVVLDQALSGLLQNKLYRWRARVLYAPFRVTEPNITPPPEPSHGPWRRLAAQSAEADIRIGLPDSDDDGVPDELEVAAPNGGDGDGDGTADALQASVASLPDATTSQYVSVAASGGCAALGSVQTLTELQAGPDDPAYGYPRGLVRVTLPCASASVKIFYHGAPSPVPPYRKYGPTTPGVPVTAQWYGFPGATFGSQLVGGVPVSTVTLALADGALGDATGVDGVIVDPGGPAVQVIPALPMPAIVALALLLGASAAGALRMRRR